MTKIGGEIVMIEYRVARSSDISGMLDLFQELKKEGAQVGFTHIEDVEELQQQLKDENIVLYVAVDPEKGKIAGILRGKRGASYQNHSAFMTAAVAKSYRGKQIAKELTHYGMEDLAEKGVKIARTYVYSNNKASLNTLLSCGFTISGSVHMHHFSEETGQYVDDIIVHKLLNDK